MTSIFTDKSQTPDTAALKKALGSTFTYWQDMEKFTLSKHAGLTSEWKYSGLKFGWSFRISDKKRVILYLLPRKGYFKAAFVFSQNAVTSVMNSNADEQIKLLLSQSVKHTEGTGIRIDIHEKSQLKDIKLLVTIKLAN